MLSADNLSKQFGHRASPTQCGARSGSKLFDADGIPERFILKKKDNNFEKQKIIRQQKFMQNYPAYNALLNILNVWPLQFMVHCLYSEIIFCLTDLPCNRMQGVGSDKVELFGVKLYFCTHQFKHVFWVLERTVSLRRFF